MAMSGITETPSHRADLLAEGAVLLYRLPGPSLARAIILLRREASQRVSWRDRVVMAWWLLTGAA